MRSKRMAEFNVGIDLDARVIGRWRELALEGLSLVHGDALATLRSIQPGEGDLVYCDPPYLAETRRRKHLYRHDYDVADHEALIDFLRSLRCNVLLSGYRSAFHDKRLGDWNRTDFVARTHSGPAVETVWTNFRQGPVLHDYAFVGADFRERERLRRRIRSMVARLAKADPLERNAVLAAVADTQPEAVRAAALRI